MIPGMNFNPSFANLAALHGMGGMHHPIGSPVPRMPMPTPTPTPTQWFPWQSGATGGLPPMQPGGMPPQGNFNNLQALMQMFGQR